jgi:hypothetical protein
MRFSSELAMTMGIALTHWTIRVAVALYVISIVQQLLARGGDSAQPAGRLAWTAGCALLWLHVALAMHFVYGWDHGRMMRETARQTAAITGVDFAGGVYFNYAFMLIWAADASAWWMLGEKRYRRRAVWVSIIVHAFLAFIAINAVVVFANGPVRWCGIAACATIAGVAFWTTIERKQPATRRVARDIKDVKR